MRNIRWVIRNISWPLRQQAFWAGRWSSNGGGPGNLIEISGAFFNLLMEKLYKIFGKNVKFMKKCAAFRQEAKKDLCMIEQRWHLY